MCTYRLLLTRPIANEVFDPHPMSSPQTTKGAQPIRVASRNTRVSIRTLRGIACVSLFKRPSRTSHCYTVRVCIIIYILGPSTSTPCMSVNISSLLSLSFMPRSHHITTYITTSYQQQSVSCIFLRLCGLYNAQDPERGGAGRTFDSLQGVSHRINVKIVFPYSEGYFTPSLDTCSWERAFSVQLCGSLLPDHSADEADGAHRIRKYMRAIILNSGYIISHRIFSPLKLRPIVYPLISAHSTSNSSTRPDTSHP